MQRFAVDELSMQIRLDRKRIAWQRVGDEVIVIDTLDGKVVGLNPVASFIWPEIESADFHSLAWKVSEEFDVSFDEARRDLGRFIESLGKRGFLRVADVPV